MMAKILAWVAGAIAFLFALFGWKHERLKRKQAEREREALKHVRRKEKETGAAVKNKVSEGKQNVEKSVDRARSGKRDHFE